MEAIQRPRSKRSTIKKRNTAIICVLDLSIWKKWLTKATLMPKRRTLTRQSKEKGRVFWHRRRPLSWPTGVRLIRRLPTAIRIFICRWLDFQASTVPCRWFPWPDTASARRRYIGRRPWKCWISWLRMNLCRCIRKSTRWSPRRSMSMWTALTL